MSEGKYDFKALGLSLVAVVGLMAIIAATAQAGEYKREGSSFTSQGIASESVGGPVHKGELLIPGLALTFYCVEGTLSGTILLGGTGHATILFSGCEVLGNKFCKIFETKAKMEADLAGDAGFIVASGLGETVLMGGKHFFLAASGATPFTTIYLSKSSLGCTLPLEEPVTGSVVFGIPNGLTPLLTQTFTTLTQAELESLWPSDVLKYGNQSAWFHPGSALVKLTGVNAGIPWVAE